MGARVRKRIQVRGTVQGVGFRPFVFNLAKRLQISGFVRNTEAGVEIEADHCAISRDFELVEQPYRRSGLALGRAERAEIMLADQQRSGE